MRRRRRRRRYQPLPLCFACSRCRSLLLHAIVGSLYSLQNDLKDLTPGQIWFKALYTLFAGLGIVGVFSDPMCDVLSAMTNPDYQGSLGNHIPIDPFFVSFIVTPICSNASELISSLAFAAKKTKKSISMTYGV
jgi:hypothetical protein